MMTDKEMDNFIEKSQDDLEEVKIPSIVFNDKKVMEDENDTKNLVDNVTLISGDQKTSGYWGDIMSGPFICYGNNISTFP